MNDFECGLPVTCLIEFTEAFNEALDFKKFDVTLDSLKEKANNLGIDIAVYSVEELE